MVSTKLLPTLYSNTILLKPRLRRSMSMSFGLSYFYSYSHAYGYKKLSNECESQSLIDSINSSNIILCGVAGPADDDSKTVDSVFSILFSVGDQSITSSSCTGGCSYSYSLCSDKIIQRPRPPVKEHGGEDGFGTIDTSDYTNCTFDLRLMSRHAGLDYNGRSLPKAKVSTSPIKPTVASHVNTQHFSLQSSHDADIMEGARIVKEQLGVIARRQVLEKTFDSDIDEDEDLPTSAQAQLLTGKVGSISDDERKGHRVRKWLRRRNPMSSLVRSLNSPAA